MRIEEEIKVHFRNDNHKLIVNLTYTVNQLNYRFLQQLKKHRLTKPQYNILIVLHGSDCDSPVTIGFLKDSMFEKNSDVSRIIERLFEKGLVSRNENPSDRRQKDVEITEKGIELISAMGFCEKETDKLFQYLKPDEVIQLNQLLDKIRG